MSEKSWDSKELVSKCMVCYRNNLILTCLLYIFSMVMTRGLGLGTSGLDRLGLSDDEIVDLISTQVTSKIKEAIPELFDSIKTRLIDMFHNPYADVTNISVATTIIIVAAGVPQRGG